MQANDCNFAELREIIAAQYQQTQRAQAAQDAKLDLVFSMMIKLQNDMASFMASMSSHNSSSSGSRYNCPMGCGSNFKKVGCAAHNDNAVHVGKWCYLSHIYSGKLPIGSSLQIMQTQQKGISARYTVTVRIQHGES
jgi:hypothetical protein